MTDEITPASGEDVERLKARAKALIGAPRVVIDIPHGNDHWAEWLNASAPVPILSIIAWGEAAERERDEAREIIRLSANDFCGAADIYAENFPNTAAEIRETAAWLRQYVADGPSALKKLADDLNDATARAEAAESRAAQDRAAMRGMAGALFWYAEHSEPGKFSVVDENREFVADLHDIAERARAALSTPSAAVALAEREVVEAGRTNAIRREAQRDGRWPDAVSDGLTIPCHDCGATPRFDYGVTDEFWRQWVPGPERTSVVCLPCLDKRCGGVGLAKALGEIHWTGTGHTVVLSPTFRHEYAARAKAEGEPARDFSPCDNPDHPRGCMHEAPKREVKPHAWRSLSLNGPCKDCGLPHEDTVHAVTTEAQQIPVGPSMIPTPAGTASGKRHEFE